MASSVGEEMCVGKTDAKLTDEISHAHPKFARALDPVVNWLHVWM